MYGYFHEALVSFILRETDNDEEQLHKILSEIGLPDQNNFYDHYDDDKTKLFFEKAVEFLKQPMWKVQSEAGVYVIDMLLEMGYNDLIKSVGKNFKEMLRNLDSMHLNLLNSYPKMKCPSFKIVQDIDKFTFNVQYRTSRPYLRDFTVGYLKNVALSVYDTDLEVTLLTRHKDVEVSPELFPGCEDVPVADCDIFEFKTSELGSTYSARSSRRGSTVEFMNPCEMSTEDVHVLFPWHIQFNRKLELVSGGKPLLERVSKALNKNDPLEPQHVSLFNIVRMIQPGLEKGATFDDFLQAEGHQCTLVLRDAQYRKSKQKAKKGVSFQNGRTIDIICEEDESENTGDGTTRIINPPSRVTILKNAAGGCPFSSRGGSNRSSVDSTCSSEDLAIEQYNEMFTLTGQLRYLETRDTMIFVGLPQVSKLSTMRKRGVKLNDIPHHSMGRELLLSNEHQSATMDMASKLKEAGDKIDRTLKELDEQKKRSDELLYSILPVPVADQLAKGTVPEAERYEEVAILFSDIVGFTNISGSVAPSKVMKMLNELFSRFDALCEKHGVYKVETIGDAYMVTSGLPDPSDDQMERLAAFALDMVAASGEVSSPADGRPVRIRVGVHSGPIMAGVVGKARPRYCLFGDTVNVASRMESTSVAGCIQISGTVRHELKRAFDLRRASLRRSKDLLDAVDFDQPGEETNTLPVACDNEQVKEMLPEGMVGECVGSFLIVDRGETLVKGKGKMNTFFLVGANGQVEAELLPPVDALHYHCSAADIKSPPRPATPAVGPSEPPSNNPGGANTTAMLSALANLHSKQIDAPITYYDVSIVWDDSVSRVAGVSSTTCLLEVIKSVSIRPVETSEGCPKIHAFADAGQCNHLVLSQPLQAVIESGAADVQAVEGGRSTVTLFVAWGAKTAAEPHKPQQRSSLARCIPWLIHD